MFNSLGSKISEMFSSSNSVSSVRFGFLLWTIGAFLMWVVIGILRVALIEIPSSVVTLIGVLAGLKGAQKIWGDEEEKK